LLRYIHFCALCCYVFSTSSRTLGAFACSAPPFPVLLFSTNT
jgi:hypothetical protein